VQYRVRSVFSEVYDLLTLREAKCTIFLCWGKLSFGHSKQKLALGVFLSIGERERELRFSLLKSDRHEVFVIFSAYGAV
jgi:hypothetical protein